MPNQYRKKNCPYCGIEHRQRGPYCSKSHSNMGRNPEVYEKHSNFMKYTDKGRELTANLKNQEIDELPEFSNLTVRPKNSFVADGDLCLADNSSGGGGDW